MSDMPPPHKKLKLRHPRFSNAIEMVTFYVTDEEGDEEKFTVHKQYACRYSPVFREAFSQSSEYRMEDTPHHAFTLLVQWLYGQQLELLLLDEDFDQHADGSRELIDYEYLSLLELWFLADKLGIPRLQNKVVETWSKAYEVDEKGPSAMIVSLIYLNTEPGSPLRKLAVDLIFRHCPGGSEFLEMANRCENGLCAIPLRDALVDIVAYTLENFGEAYEYASYDQKEFYVDE